MQEIRYEPTIAIFCLFLFSILSAFMPEGTSATGFSGLPVTSKDGAIGISNEITTISNTGGNTGKAADEGKEEATVKIITEINGNEVRKIEASGPSVRITDSIATTSKPKESVKKVQPKNPDRNNRTVLKKQNSKEASNATAKIVTAGVSKTSNSSSAIIKSIAPDAPMARKKHEMEPFQARARDANSKPAGLRSIWNSIVSSLKEIAFIFN